jgi:quinol-cytochrome oxidoreductase complex cytochrome b subunit
MVGAILVLLIVPFINTSDVRNTTPIFKICFGCLLLTFILDLEDKTCETFL